MDQISEEDVETASMSILSRQTIDKICSKLDSHKFLLSENKYHRDWRGLAQHVDLEVSQIRSMKLSPTEYCLKLWVKNGLKVKDYWKCLEEMDRYDVIDDNCRAIYDDLNRHNNSLSQVKCSPLESIQNSIDIRDSNILTIDDVHNMRNGGSLQFYNALVLYIAQDIAFVQEMVFKLEGEYNMKICLIDRELIGGIQFEYEAVARLIQERCMRVIVVLSPSFLQSPTNNFFIAFAQALSIDQRRRIVIPCMLEPCQKPTVIAFCHSLDYYRTKGYWNYWEKLADSIRPSCGEIKSQIMDVTQLTVKNDDLKRTILNNAECNSTLSTDEHCSNSSKYDLSPSWSSAGALCLPEPPTTALPTVGNTFDKTIYSKKKKKKSGFSKKIEKIFHKKKKTNMLE